MIDTPKTSRAQNMHPCVFCDTSRDRALFTGCGIFGGET